MKNTSKFALVILTIILISCSALGTQTLYKSNSNFKKPLKIGFSQLANEGTVEKIVRGSAKIYENTMSAQLELQNIKSTKFLMTEFDGFQNINKTEIKNICAKNQLDGMILAQLKFLNVRYNILLIPVGESEDTEVEMQYYDANGNLLLHTKHNTYKGNSYWNIPSASKTVVDGTKGALRQILKEITS